MGLLKKEEKKPVYVESDRGSCFSLENLRELFIARERESFPEGRRSEERRVGKECRL